MDYLKYVSNGYFAINTDSYKPEYFDSHGLMARFKVVSGELRISSMNYRREIEYFAEYPVATGETLDFIGEVKLCGNATVQYILFDKV